MGPFLSSLSMLGGDGPAQGPASPRNPLTRPLGGSGVRPSDPQALALALALRSGQPSGGEKTTITFKGSVMWWNLCGTPAGT